MYPDAKRSQYKQTKKDEERVLKVFRLRDPNLDVHTMWTQDAEDDGSDNEGMIDQRYLRLDISLKEQVYRTVEDAKQNGITQKDIATKLGLSKLCVRALIRIYERLDMFTTYMKDQGRQRISM